MKTNHTYRYDFKNQSLTWNSDLSHKDFIDLIYGESLLNWELTVIAVSLGQTMESKLRLISLNGMYFWMEQIIVPIFEGIRICGFEGRISLQKK